MTQITAGETESQVKHLPTPESPTFQYKIDGVTCVLLERQLLLPNSAWSAEHSFFQPHDDVEELSLGILFWGLRSHEKLSELL